jgi:hypothetical protein
MGTPIKFGSPDPDDGGTTVNPYQPREGDLPPGEEVTFEEVNVGDQVTVFAMNIPDHRTLDGVKIYKLTIETFAHEVQVHGKVDDVLLTPNGIVSAFISMRTEIVVTERTRIKVMD